MMNLVVSPLSIVTLKKMSWVRRVFFGRGSTPNPPPPTFSFNPHPPYAAEPMLIMYTLRCKLLARVRRRREVRGGDKSSQNPSLPNPAPLLLKSLQTSNVYIRGASSLYFRMASGSEW